MIKTEDTKDFYTDFINEMAEESGKNYIRTSAPVQPTPNELENLTQKNRLLASLESEKRYLENLTFERNKLKTEQETGLSKLISPTTGFLICLLTQFLISQTLFEKIAMLILMLPFILNILKKIGKLFLDMDRKLSRTLSDMIHYTSIPMEIDILDEQILCVTDRIFVIQNKIDSIELPDYLEYH